MHHLSGGIVHSARVQYIVIQHRELRDLGIGNGIVQFLRFYSRIQVINEQR